MSPKNIKRCLWGSLAIISAFLIFLAVLPYGLELGIEKYLKRIGASDVKVENVDFNPFYGRLVIFNLSFGPESSGFTAGSMSIKVDWWPLWKRRLGILGITVENASVHLERKSGGTWILGGLPLKPGETGATDGGTSEPWGLMLGSASMRNLRVVYQDGGNRHEMIIDKAELGPIVSWQPETEGQIAAAFHLDGGSISARGAIRPFSEPVTFAGDVEAEGLELSKYPEIPTTEKLKSVSGSVKLNLALDARFSREDQGFSIKTSGNVDIEKARFGFAQAGKKYMAEGAGLAIEGKVNASREPAGKVSYEISLDSVVRNPGVSDLSSDLSLVETKSIAVRGFHFDGVSMEVAGVSISDLNVFEQGKGSSGESKKSRQFAFHAGLADINGLSLKDQSDISVGPIRVKDFDARIIRMRTGVYEVGRWVGKKTGPKAGSESRREKVSYEVKGISLEGKNRIFFLDEAAEPDVRLVISSVTGRIGSIKSGGGKAETPFKISAGIGDHGKIQMSGTAALGAERMQASMKGEVKELDLPVFSPYSARALGYAIKSGHLALDWSGRYSPGMLKLETDLTLSGFNLEPAKDGSEKFMNILGFSAETASSILRDKNGDINLKIPVEGDPASPDFKLGAVIAKAAGNAIKKGAVGYFAPLGVTLITGIVLPPGTTLLLGKILDWTLTLRFKPVTFAPGVSDLDDASLAYLEKTARLLDGRPKVKLLLCGYSVPADLAALREAAGTAASNEEGKKDSGMSGEAADAILPTDDEKESLLRLAEERSRQVKNFLISNGAMPAERLFRCEPVYDDTSGAEGRVNISG